MALEKLVLPHCLDVANGCVADSSFAKAWPTKESGNTDGAKEDAILPSTMASEASTLSLPEIVIYEHSNFSGASVRTNLGWYEVGDWWNDKISSIVVVSGVWRFYEHWHFEGRYWDIGPGYYYRVEEGGIPNDVISSFRIISY